MTNGLEICAEKLRGKWIYQLSFETVQLGGSVLMEVEDTQACLLRVT